MTKRRWGLAVVVACGLFVPLLLLDAVLWAAPGMDPERQTVPTRTPTSPPSPPSTPTPREKKEPPEPPPPAATPTSTLEPIPTETPTIEPSRTPVPPSPTPLPAWDFGDAPDPSFPSLLESDGARHANLEFEWLGEEVDQEHDSRQVDEDLFDDGVDTGDLTACTQADVKVRVTVRVRDDSRHPYDAEHLLYLNVLVDWDSDGSWRGRISCPNGLVASEWAVQNLLVDVSSWPGGDTSTVVSLTFPIGPRTGQVWSRFTLSYGEVVSGDRWDGRGAFAFGETEDYLVTIEPAPTATPAMGSPTPETMAIVTPTPAAESAGATGVGWWPSLPCFGGGLVVGIVLGAVWASRREGG